MTRRFAVFPTSNRALRDVEKLGQVAVCNVLEQRVAQYLGQAAEVLGEAIQHGAISVVGQAKKSPREGAFRTAARRRLRCLSQASNRA